jgi:hypothetical protein
VILILEVDLLVLVISKFLNSLEEIIEYLTPEVHLENMIEL